MAWRLAAHRHQQGDLWPGPQGSDLFHCLLRGALRREMPRAGVHLHAAAHLRGSGTPRSAGALFPTVQGGAITEAPAPAGDVRRPQGLTARLHLSQGSDVRSVAERSLAISTAPNRYSLYLLKVTNGMTVPAPPAKVTWKPWKLGAGNKGSRRGLPFLSQKTTCRLGRPGSCMSGGMEATPPMPTTCRATTPDRAAWAEGQSTRRMSPLPSPLARTFSASTGSLTGLQVRGTSPLASARPAARGSASIPTCSPNTRRGKGGRSSLFWRHSGEHQRLRG